MRSLYRLVSYLLSTPTLDLGRCSRVRVRTTVSRFRLLWFLLKSRSRSSHHRASLAPLLPTSPSSPTSPALPSYSPMDWDRGSGRSSGKRSFEELAKADQLYDLELQQCERPWFPVWHQEELRFREEVRSFSSQRRSAAAPSSSTSRGRPQSLAMLHHRLRSSLLPSHLLLIPPTPRFPRLYWKEVQDNVLPLRRG
jgi:hypothetical protein